MRARSFLFVALLTGFACGGDDGTGPTPDPNADSDGDTIRDGDEGAPTATDTDGDGVPDFQDADADGDGIDDYREAGDADPVTPPAAPICSAPPA